MGYDLTAVSGHNAQFGVALTGLIAAHQKFQKILNETQVDELEKPLGELDKLWAELTSQTTLLDQELMATYPNSQQISGSVYKITKTAGRWHAQHKKIAKEMSIPQ